MTGNARAIQGNDLLLTLHFRRHIGRTRPPGSSPPRGSPKCYLRLSVVPLIRADDAGTP